MYELAPSFSIIFIFRYISHHVNRPGIFRMVPKVILFLLLGNELPLLPLLPCTPQTQKSLDHAMTFRPSLIAERKLCPKEGT